MSSRPGSRALAITGALLVFQGAVAWRTGVLANGGGGEADPGQPARLIAALNACIQERFKEIDEGFGIRRLIRIGETPHTFRPEQASELTAVAALEAAHLRVVLYLTGRRVRAPKPDTSRWGQADAWRLIKGPVAITRVSPVADSGTPPFLLAPPPPLALWDESRRAFEAFETSDAHHFASGAWRFIAKPVRAGDAACLKCHSEPGAISTGRSPTRPVRLGDPLGVVLYGYQHR
jgi:hypothetical protein